MIGDTHTAAALKHVANNIVRPAVANGAQRPKYASKIKNSR